ncbi:putative uncharacterized protein DDB_G0271606 isoform X1 [Drosophila novamexicana]|nr:putative uncharacterized protein DDB_G0271606 isoform X1 [Drosophila novamexicana]
MPDSYTYHNNNNTRTAMAFSGHMNSDGEIVLSDEIYTGRTRICSISTPSEPSEQSEHSEHSEHSEQSGLDTLEYMDSRRWEPSNLEGPSNLLYKDQGESSSSSSSTPLSLPPADGSTYTHSKADSNSLYSYTNMYGSLKPMEKPSNRVPSLGLSSKSSMLDYMRELDGLKLDRQPQVAYETWYASKQRLRQQELQRQKEEREHEIEKHELRKQLAKLSYDQWLRDKARQAAQRRMDNHMQHAALQAAASSVANRAKASNKPVRNVPQAEISQVVQSWWLKKQEQQQRQRQEQQHHLLKKAREEQRRKQMAEKAWQNWMSNVYGKPKPVPMNQGMDSLRGTVSEIYLNPAPWQSLKKSPNEL